MLATVNRAPVRVCLVQAFFVIRGEGGGEILEGAGSFSGQALLLSYCLPLKKGLVWLGNFEETTKSGGLRVDCVPLESHFERGEAMWHRRVWDECAAVQCIAGPPRGVSVGLWCRSKSVIHVTSPMPMPLWVRPCFKMEGCVCHQG